jgi:ribose/xylose/arabinose/galactoside ABC-type transport system permease subunit
MSTVLSPRQLPVSNDLLLRVLDNMIWPILLLISLGIAVLVPETFRNLASVQFILHGSAPLGFVVLAEAVCLISGHFDLSVGAIAGFSAMFTGMIISSSQWALVTNPAAAVAIILLTGIVIGAVNGTVVSKFGVNPFLQTLAALIILEGAKLTLSTSTLTGLPEGYTIIGDTDYVSVGGLVVAYIAIGLIMRYTRFGQAIYALGSDRDSARAVGIQTDRVIIAVYVISGLLSATAGMMATGYTGVVPPGIGEGLVFPAFAASVIGGVSLFGGRGKVQGAFGGVVLLGVVQSALTVSGTPPEQIQLVNGIVLLVAILLYNSRSRLREEILSTEVDTS